MSDRNEENRKWNIMQLILLISIIAMIVFAIAYFFFDLPIKFLPVIFIFPFFGGFLRKK